MNAAAKRVDANWQGRASGTLHEAANRVEINCLELEWALDYKEPRVAALFEHPDEPGRSFKPVAAQQTVTNLVRSGRKQR